MSTSKLPAHASLEYLKKLAKERLREMRRTEPAARLAAAQLSIAREYGFPSWRALKAEMDRRSVAPVDALFRACREGDLDTVQSILRAWPDLARERTHGTTALHQAVKHGAIVRILLDHGADANARDEGDNALPLHFAAGSGSIDSVRALLDAGSDVHGHGDAHAGDVIGWAACGREPHRDVVDLLLERGARHHIFSAIAMDDAEAVRRVVAEQPDAFERRTSKYESLQSPIHFTLFEPDGLGGRAALPQYDMLDLLLELGADVDMKDGRGRTALDLALLLGHTETAQLLRAAGAREPDVTVDDSPAALAEIGRSIREQLTPMLNVKDVGRSVAWYESIGFRMVESYGEDGVLNFAYLTLGRSALMLSLGGTDDPKPVSLWFQVDRLDDFHAALKARQFRAAQGNAAVNEGIRFSVDLHEAFYGQREFGIEDPDGYVLYFARPIMETS